MAGARIIQEKCYSIQYVISGTISLFFVAPYWGLLLDMKQDSDELGFVLQLQVIDSPILKVYSGRFLDQNFPFRFGDIEYCSKLTCS